MDKIYPESKVELDGFLAAHYDALLNLITFGSYPSIMKKAIRLMKIRPDDRIIDLGTGTGKNACLMMGYLSIDGELVGLDISKEMISQFKKRCSGFPNARIVNRRIDRLLPYKEEFDKALLSFVLHGFPQGVREDIVNNVFTTLKEKGELFILDYSQFSLEDMPFYLRIPFKLMECSYAADFIKKDWKEILSSIGFNRFEEHFFGEYLRLLKSIKEENPKAGI